jgi:hypothetical protein
MEQSNSGEKWEIEVKAALRPSDGLHKLCFASPVQTERHVNMNVGLKYSFSHYAARAVTLLPEPMTKVFHITHQGYLPE